MGRRALTAAVVAVAVLVVLASGCGSSTNGSSAPTRLTDLRDITQLRSLFNSRSGEPRLILLVSPT
jgi:hypothetical protein